MFTIQTLHKHITVDWSLGHDHAWQGKIPSKNLETIAAILLACSFFSECERVAYRDQSPKILTANSLFSINQK